MKMRAALGKTLTADEQARLGRLQDRYGVNGPGSIAGLDAQLTRPGSAAAAAAAGRQGQQPTINAPVQIAVDEKRLVNVMLQAVIPVIDRKLDNLDRAARDRRHAAGVKGGM